MDRRLPDGNAFPSGLKNKCLTGHADARVFEAERGFETNQGIERWFPTAPCPVGKKLWEATAVDSH